MLEYIKAGEGSRLSMIVLHDDAKREYAYGPAQGLPETTVGAFPPGSCTTWPRRRAGSIISMKDDWKRIFAFE